MKRYHLFMGTKDDAGGGLWDYVGAFSSPEAAQAGAGAPGDGWAEIAYAGDDGQLRTLLFWLGGPGGGAWKSLA